MCEMRHMTHVSPHGKTKPYKKAPTDKTHSHTQRVAPLTRKDTFIRTHIFGVWCAQHAICILSTFCGQKTRQNNSA